MYLIVALPSLMLIREESIELEGRFYSRMPIQHFVESRANGTFG